MKKNLLLFVFVFAVTVFTGNAGTDRYASAGEKENAEMYYYYWFMDPQFNSPTGAYTDINSRMNDLRNTFPSNIFSAYFSMGLHQFEYGYKPGEPTKIIFSDLED